MYQVIVIDDEPKLITGMIRHYPWHKLGFEVAASFESAQEALDYLESHPVDVIVSDIAMPEMTGIDLAREVRNRFINAKLVFISGYADFKYAQQAVRYGASDYLLKPVKKEEFCAVFEKIRASLSRERTDWESEASYYDKIVKKTEKYLKESLREANLKEAAERVGLSDSYLSVIFKQHTGKTFSEALQEIRMEEARRLLKNEYLKIYEIAQRLGYDDPKNFTRAFRNYYGISPREYRNS